MISDGSLVYFDAFKVKRFRAIGVEQVFLISIASLICLLVDFYYQIIIAFKVENIGEIAPIVKSAVHVEGSGELSSFPPFRSMFEFIMLTN